MSGVTYALCSAVAAAVTAILAKIGVEGVPFFIFNRRIAVSGAQPPEVLLEAMLKSEKQPVASE